MLAQPRRGRVSERLRAAPDDPERRSASVRERVGLRGRRRGAGRGDVERVVRARDRVREAGGRSPAVKMAVVDARSRRGLGTGLGTVRGTGRGAVRGSGRAAAAVSVVSVIRPTAEHPQVPSGVDAVLQPVMLPNLYDDRGRLVVPSPMFGSRQILLRQNEVADLDGLGRVQNDEDLQGMRQKRMLVPLPVSDGLRVDGRLPENRRYCRAWTAQFLADLARAHMQRFGTALQVNSAVRTVEFQQKLLRRNGNAAPADGETASPHLTGQAIDLAKRGLSMAEIAWMRGYLGPLVEAGKVDVEEEFQQSCFHISVYRKYLPAPMMPAVEPFAQALGRGLPGAGLQPQAIVRATP